MRFWDMRGWTSKFFGVSMKLNFLPSGGIDHKYFLSPKNDKRSSINHLLRYGAIQSSFGVTRGSKVWLFWWKFLTPFLHFWLVPTNRFSYELAHWRPFKSCFEPWNNISHLTTSFWDMGDEKILVPPTIFPNFGFRAPKFFCLVRDHSDPCVSKISWSYP